MRFQKFWGILALIITVGILAGCSAKPYAEIYMEPVADDADTEVNAKTGSITVEQQKVRITLKPLDEVELYNLTKDSDVNPYIDVSTWGNVKPLYTVFEIHIENLNNQRVEFDQAVVLVDEDGVQYNSLSYEDFKDLYTHASLLAAPTHNVNSQNIPYPRDEGDIQYASLSYGDSGGLYTDAGLQKGTVQNVGYHYGGYGHHGYGGYGYHGYRYGYRSYGHGYPYSYGYRGYGYRGYGYGYPYSYGYRSYGSYGYSHAYDIKRALLFARKTVFDGAKLVTGAKHTGLLVFDRIQPDVKHLKVIIPDVRIIEKAGQVSKADFTFNFQQVIVTQE